MKNFGSIRKLIYQLKREWPTQIRIKRETVETDPESGEKTPTILLDVTIRKAILLPSRMITDFVYDLSFVAANKNFSYGGFFDKDSRVVVIDAEDIRDYTINLHDQILIGNRRNVCENAGYIEGPNGRPIAYILAIKDIKGIPDV